MESYLRRKSNDPKSLPPAVQNQPELCLLRVIFGIPDDGDEETLREVGVHFEGETYAPKELAADLGMSVFSIYKMFSEERPIRFGHAIRILNFIHFKNAADTRLLDFICEPVGFVPMPKLVDVDRKKVRAVLMAAQELTKGDRE